MIRLNGIVGFVVHPVLVSRKRDSFVSLKRRHEVATEPVFDIFHVPTLRTST